MFIEAVNLYRNSSAEEGLLRECMLSRSWLFCNPVDCGPPGSSVYGISQARILEWVAISSSRGSSRPRNRTRVSCIVGRFFTFYHCATWEALGFAERQKGLSFHDTLFIWALPRGFYTFIFLIWKVAPQIVSDSSPTKPGLFLASHAVSLWNSFHRLLVDYPENLTTI